jgi:glycosyltransferase involved in cell wall biosynthesis
MAPRRRVLHVLGTADRAGTAIFRIVEGVALSAISSKYQFEVCFLQPGELADRLTDIGIPWTCVNWKGSLNDPGGAARYAALLRSSEFCIIHQHTGATVLTTMGRRLTRARIVQSLHGRVSEERGVVLPRKRVPKTDALIANSRIMAQYSRDPRAVLIYPGIDATIFSAHRKDHNGVVIGTACRLEPVKGVSHLIKAVALLAPDFPGLRLEIAGDGSLRADLIEDCRELGISSLATFVGWREDLHSLMSSWDIFAMPSLDEAFGYAALEAMAVGLPVVASAVGGLPELIRDGLTGRLVPPADSAALAAGLRQLVADPAQRHTMGTAGRMRAGEKFPLSRMVEQTIALYDRLCA